MKTTSWAPGRVEVLGNHTDYNGGEVLSAALDLGISAEGEPLPDGSIQLSSEGLEGILRLDPGEEWLPTATWADYPLGVAKILRDAGHPIGGFSAHFHSTLPLGAGLSSSAALEVCTATLLTKLFHFSLAPLELAKLCRRAENEFVGVNCGLLDQASSVFGRADHLIHLDCRAESICREPITPGWKLLIVNSGVKHALTGGEYNERREQCFAAAEGVGVPQLRDTTSAELASADLPDLVKRRGLHITGENERVRTGCAALAKGDLVTFGQLMTASHESSRHNFENSTPELDLLVELANACPGITGARLSGGGFGGAIVALVEESAAPAAAEAILAGYTQRSGHTGAAYICAPADGAMIDQTRSLP
jgi:galactokinase